MSTLAYDSTAWVPADTWEIKVLDGFSFSQGTSTQEVTLNEAGAAPNRGQKIFNTALDPVDFSFSTYVRPFKTAGASSDTPGIADYGLAGAATYGADSGLAPSTAYSTDITVDSVLQQVNFTTSADAIISYADVISEINQVLTGAYADLHAGNIRIVSDSVNASSTILIATGTGGGADVGPTLTDWVSYTTPVDGVTGTGTLTTSAEKVLWDAITNNGASPTPDTMNVDFANSNVHELPKFALYIDVGTSVFRISEAIISSAEIDFSIDGIGMINWTGQGSFYDIPAYVPGTSHPEAGDFTSVPPDADFIKNKLSTVTMVGGPANSGLGATYTLGMTAASISIDNGVTFLTPEELGVVNTPIGHFTGTRAISGSLTCYLDDADNKSLALLSDMLANTDTTTNEFQIVLNMGGVAVPFVSFEMPRAHIVIPQIESEDVISTSVEFTALGTNLTSTDEMTVSYYAKTTVA